MSFLFIIFQEVYLSMFDWSFSVVVFFQAL